MILPLFISTTGVASDGTEFVKSWVLNWDKVAQANGLLYQNSCQ